MTKNHILADDQAARHVTARSYHPRASPSMNVPGTRSPSQIATEPTPMVEKSQPPEPSPAEGALDAPPAPRRGSGHRGADVRDTVGEMAAKAQEISLEAGTKVGAAMKDVISAAVGLAGFAIESARDLVQYMVRRGQMTQDEADKLIREAEEAHGKRNPGALPARSSSSGDHAPSRSVPERAAGPADEPGRGLAPT